jgi:tetratricopeptide (TPR) repeat protein
VKLSLYSFVIVCFIVGCSTFGFRDWGDYAYLEKAEEFSRQAKYDEAIDAYRKHMRYRLSLEDRPPWENPYLYLLMIGDLQLNQDKPEEARASYELAEKNKVDTALISDRYRYLATWYDKRGDIDAALKILSTYRDRDDMLFDVMRDRLAKELVKREREGSLIPTPTPSANPTVTISGAASE